MTLVAQRVSGLPAQRVIGGRGAVHTVFPEMSGEERAALRRSVETLLEAGGSRWIG